MASSITIERSEIWWLAHGSSSHPRQPSFASATALQSVSRTYYSFGWNRVKSCFVMKWQHDVLPRPIINEYPCERIVALGLLWLCGRKNVIERFFCGHRNHREDRDLYMSAGHVFGLTVMGHEAEASLHFYSPARRVNRIHLHHGMTADFRHRIGGMPARTIYNNLR